MEQEMKAIMLEDNVTSPEVVETEQPVAQVSFDVEREQRKQKINNILKNIFVYLFLTICAAAAFLPFFWMFVTSVKDEHSYRDPTSHFSLTESCGKTTK